MDTEFLNGVFQKKTFCGTKVNSILMNASGCHCTLQKELNDLNKCKFAGVIVSKSCTENPRIGNPKPRYHCSKGTSINSTGLANLGSEFYMSRTEFEKPYIVSIAGCSIEENKRLFEKALKSKVKYFEINASCPNIQGKSQTGYNLETKTEESLSYLMETVGQVFQNSDKKIGFKLPPYFDENQFESVANIINQTFEIYKLPHWITTINSPGNGLILDENFLPTIKPKNGFGGIGGQGIKPFALANVKKMRNLLLPEIQIIGCGGIKNGRDIVEHLVCGADLVQVGTTLYEEGIESFERLAKELDNQKKVYFVNL